MKFSTSGGMGAALMYDLDNAKKIMKALKDEFGNKISVSCKIRILDDYEESLKFICEIQEYAKIDFISVHPRTKEEKSQVPSRWFIVKKLVESGKIKIPLLGSGDMFSALDIAKFLSFTGANGVIVARGAIHNPSIFSEKKEIFQNMMQKDFPDLDQIWIENTNKDSHEIVIKRIREA